METKEPLTRVINGFRIIPVEVQVLEGSTFIWYILPNRSSRAFYFAKLSCAEQFCKQYSNVHSDKFWFRLWSSFPLYHKDKCLSVVSPFSYMP